MKSVVNLTFAGDDGAIHTAKLFEHRNAKRAPQKVAVVISQCCATNRCENNHRITQGGQIQQPTVFLVRQIQREV